VKKEIAFQKSFPKELVSSLRFFIDHRFMLKPGFRIVTGVVSPIVAFFSRAINESFQRTRIEEIVSPFPPTPLIFQSAYGICTFPLSEPPFGVLFILLAEPMKRLLPLPPRDFSHPFYGGFFLISGRGPVERRVFARPIGFS